MSNMVQYGVWANCSNDCSFCLREERIPISKTKQLARLDAIKENIDFIDWKNQYSYGISLLGGELYHITDEDLQESFLELIDIIIEKILKDSNPNVKYSTVTNGIYDPTFLFTVIDRIVDSVGIEHVDVNFSYDFKYRFKTKEREKLCLDNINLFHERYDYKVGVQMILTQYVIDLYNSKKFDINAFINNKIPGNNLCFLYPHPIKTSLSLPDFNFKRNDFLKFMTNLKKDNFDTYFSFLHSVKNSSIFKHTGLKNKDVIDVKEQPLLTDGKELINTNCNHSILYQCYSDSDKCMLCDLKAMDIDIFL